MRIEVMQGVLLPFLGTMLGAACVLFMRKELDQAVQRALTGFAAGVMVAASIWSLLIPAMEQAEGMGCGPLSLQWWAFGWASCSCWSWTGRSPTSTKAVTSRRAREWR